MIGSCVRLLAWLQWVVTWMASLGGEDGLRGGGGGG